MKNKLFQRAITLLVIVTLIVPLFSGVKTTLAASKPELLSNKMTIGLGSYGMIGDVDEYYAKKKTRYVLEVYKSNEKASYTFISSDENIVKVKKEGTKGYLTGVNPGTANVTVKENLDGKTTEVGTCEITVSEATFGFASGEEVTVYLEDATDLYQHVSSNGRIMIRYYNPKATYLFEVDGEGLKIEETKEKIKIPKAYLGMMNDGDGRKPGAYYVRRLLVTAERVGEYTVTVKELYKGNTRKLGTFDVVVPEPYIEEKMKVARYSARAAWLVDHTGQDWETEGEDFKISKSQNGYELTGDGFSVKMVQNAEGRWRYVVSGEKKLEEYMASKDKVVKAIPDYDEYMNPIGFSFYGENTGEVIVTSRIKGEEEYIGETRIIVSDVKIKDIKTEKSKMQVSRSNTGTGTMEWVTSLDEMKSNEQWGKGYWDVRQISKNEWEVCMQGIEDLEFEVPLSFEDKEALFYRSKRGGNTYYYEKLWIPFSVISSDESVVTVLDAYWDVLHYGEDSEYRDTQRGKIQIRALEKGSATLTIKVGNKKKNIKITVIA